MKRETNIEFLQRVMDFAKTGAMMQLFVIDALDKVSKQVASLDLQQVRDAFGDASFVSPDAWHATAKELHEELQRRFEQR